MGSNSKAFLLLGLLLAIVLLDSSEVSARDLAKTSFDQRKGIYVGITHNVILLCYNDQVLSSRA
jgi:hypothetical protein